MTRPIAIPRVRAEKPAIHIRNTDELTRLLELRLLPPAFLILLSENAARNRDRKMIRMLDNYGASDLQGALENAILHGDRGTAKWLIKNYKRCAVHVKWEPTRGCTVCRDGCKFGVIETVIHA